MKCPDMNRIIRAALALAVCAAVLLAAAMNAPLVAPAVESGLKGERSFGEVTKAVSEGYLSDALWQKYAFIDLNGMAARLSGRRAVNDTLLLNNGMLTNGAEQFLEPSSAGKLAKGLKAFNAYLAAQDIPFVYLQVPCKVDMEGALLPAGLTNSPNAAADALLKRLSKAGVAALDLRPLLAATPADVDRSFYRTDHHWSPDAALAGFGALMAYFKSETGLELDDSLADPDRWERHEKADWFLGSLGKRLGQWAAGTDPLVWYTPRFETEMSCAIMHTTNFKKGDFSEAELRAKYIDTRDLYGWSAYDVFVGGNYRHIQHRNAKAPNDMKVLLIEDSFGLPLQAFMAASFSRVDVLDPRYYTASGVAEYCAWTKPDVVVMALNAMRTWDGDYADLGTADVADVRMGETPLATFDRVVVDAADGANNRAEALPVELAAGHVYRLTIDGFDVRAGDPPALTAAVVRRSNSSAVVAQPFDVGFYESRGESLEWTFRVPDDAKPGDCELELYAGIRKRTAGNVVEFSGVSVFEIPYTKAG